MSRFIAGLLIALFALSTPAQEKPQDRSIGTRISGLQKMDGFIPIYWDSANGKMLMEISRFNTEFLYQISLPTGVGSNPLGLDRGQLGRSHVVRFERVGPKVLMIESNYRSLVRLPDGGYKPRKLDPRVGVHGITFYDYASPITEPVEKRWIARHRLQKKDPNAAVSEPIKPIVYYVDNGAPEPIRSALVNGAAWWNAAFEAAGFKNAFLVKVLPEGADPMDLRYNMYYTYAVKTASGANPGQVQEIVLPPGNETLWRQCWKPSSSMPSRSRLGFSK